MMGIDVQQMVRMIDSAKIDKSKLKEMGSDASEMLDVFRKLSEIKKKK